MKLTHILFRQHIGRVFKQHWKVQGRRTPEDTGVHQALIEKGIPIYEANDFLAEKREYEKVEIIGLKPKPIAFDKTHPHWHDRACYVYRDDNVLLEGLTQAKVITKSVEIHDGLPEKFVLQESTKNLNDKVKHIILNSHLFDAEQQKLPKVKDPLRPMWNFPRTYGITDSRINKLITSRLLHLIELTCPSTIVKQRTIFNDLCFSYPFEKNENLIQFELRGDILLTSSKPLENITAEDTSSVDLPDIFPLKDTISLNPINIYEFQNIYPIKSNILKSHPHTLFIHHNSTEVKNLHEEEVTETQIFGRSLLKAFTVAASYAKQQYGDRIKPLPTPVTLQCIQTDGRLFHFGVLQLNTLDLESTNGVKNIWYQTPRIPLFTSCAYVSGKPTLEGYSSDVIRHLLAFYSNV